MSWTNAVILHPDLTLNVLATPMIEKNNPMYGRMKRIQLIDKMNLIRSDIGIGVSDFKSRLKFFAPAINPPMATRTHISNSPSSISFSFTLFS
jgi:hypothetical protein